jgi:hypothetical protein
MRGDYNLMSLLSIQTPESPSLTLPPCNPPPPTPPSLNQLWPCQKPHQPPNLPHLRDHILCPSRVNLPYPPPIIPCIINRNHLIRRPFQVPELRPVFLEFGGSLGGGETLPGHFDEPFAESFISVEICEDLFGDPVYDVSGIALGGVLRGYEGRMNWRYDAMTRGLSTDMYTFPR